MATVRIKTTTRPLNAEQYSVNEQVNKPMRNVFWYIFLITFGGLLVIYQGNRIYQCRNDLNAFTMFLGVGLVCGGVVALVSYLIAFNDFVLAEVVTHEETHIEPEEDDARFVPFYSGDTAATVRMYERGKDTCGIMFPNRIIKMVSELGQWPSRDSFWLKSDVWRGTGFEPWNTAKYNEATDKLEEGGILLKIGRRYQLSDNGRKFFDITDPPTLSEY